MPRERTPGSTTFTQGLAAAATGRRGALLRTLALGVSLLLGATAASAQTYNWLQSRWKPDRYLNIEHRGLQAGRIEPGWHSAMWVIEPVAGERGFVRIRNRWKPEQYLHIEDGDVQSGPIKSGWHSAMWTIEPVGGERGLHRIRNRWEADHYLHIENGEPEVGPIKSGWHSAMWVIRTAD